MRIHPSLPSNEKTFAGAEVVALPRQSRSRTLQLEVSVEGGAAQVLDPSQWRYRVLRDLDGHTSLIVTGAELHLMKPEPARTAAILGVDCAIGEAERLRRFDAILVEPMSVTDALPFSALR